MKASPSAKKTSKSAAASSTRKRVSNTKTSTRTSSAKTPSRTGATRTSKASGGAKTTPCEQAARKQPSSPAQNSAPSASTTSAGPTTATATLSSPTQTTPASAGVSDLAALQAELAARILCKRRLIPFTQRLNPRYDAGWVHKDIARRLERFSDEVAKGMSPRLMLLMPPRHGKSELASRMFPAWHLGRYSEHEIIACSYNVSLAMAFSRKVKAVLEDPGYQSVFAARLNPNNQSVEEWSLHGERGGYVAAGVGGGITGKGAHVLIIDDPIKNAEEADSAETREKLWDWYGSTAYTRLAPGGGVLVIQTWWHDDDLAGRLQLAMKDDPEADQFEVVKYPAVAEDDEYLDTSTDMILNASAIEDLNRVDATISAVTHTLGVQAATIGGHYRLLRRKGEALHPARYDTTRLNRIRKTIPSRFWSALYQQNPVPEEGAYFTKDQFKRGPMPNKERCNVMMAWDFAISEKKQNDYTVGTVGYQDDDDLLHIPEVVRFKSQDAFFIVKTILDTVGRHYQKSMVVGFEDGQIWKAISAVLLREMKARRLFFAIKLLTPITDKMARARPLQARMQQGLVVYNENASWYETVRNEMLRFPAGVHDDCVDSGAWLANLAVDRSPPPKPRQQAAKSWKDRLGSLGRTGSVSHMAA
jgi:predicted phage terminase large subunit-like protein